MISLAHYEQELRKLNWQVIERYKDRARVDGQRDLIYETLCMIRQGESQVAVISYLTLEVARAKSELKTLDGKAQWRRQRWYEGRLAMAKKLVKEMKHADIGTTQGGAGPTADDAPLLGRSTKVVG